MNKDARINWFVFLTFMFSCSFWWAIMQSLWVSDGRWGSISVASAFAMWMLIDRKMKHDELLDSSTRVSVQIQDDKSPTSGKDTVRLVITDDNSQRYAHLPLPKDELRTIAKATLNGRPFTLASWAGDGRMLSRSQFEDLRDWLIKAGYAKWADERSRNKGVVVTAKGKAVMRGLAK